MILTLLKIVHTTSQVLEKSVESSECQLASRGNDMARFCAAILILILTGAQITSAVPESMHTPNVAIPSSYFGLHIHHLNFPVPTTPWPSMPVPEWRLWDAAVSWPELEPAKGQWHFERLDLYVSLAQQHGTHMLLPLAYTPQWASGRPGVTAPPRNIEDWRNYVKAVVSRYKGRIQAYEVWNEPNLGDFWSGTTDQMVTLTKEASEVIRSVDPQAIIVSPSCTAEWGLPWFLEFVKKGGAQYTDVVGYHFYASPPSAPPEAMVPVIRRVQQIMAENGLGSKPLWNTETGWIKPSTMESDEMAAAFLARSYIVAWAAGVQRFYWYAWDNISMAIVTYREAEHQVTPAGNAYKVIQQWLVGATMVNCAETADHTWVCELNRSGKKQWIVWNPQGNRKFDVPATWRVKTVTPLLHDQISLTGSSIDIGTVPLLLTGKS